jgi:hypothetical protein
MTVVAARLATDLAIALMTETDPRGSNWEAKESHGLALPTRPVWKMAGRLPSLRWTNPG